MPRSDRAFRALAQEQPHAIFALLELCAPRLLTPGAEVRPEDVTDPSLIAPPSLEADWAARVGDDQLLHVEGQGYRDDSFIDRLLRYHLGFFLRFPDREVRSVALWLKRPRRVETGVSKRRVSGAPTATANGFRQRRTHGFIEKRAWNHPRWSRQRRRGSWRLFPLRWTNTKRSGIVRLQPRLSCFAQNQTAPT